MRNNEQDVHELKTLNMLRKGDIAIIAGMVESSEHNPDTKKRLLELGFIPGEKIKIIAESFPQHDPFVIKLGNSTFALRRHEAEIIQVLCR